MLKIPFLRVLFPKKRTPCWFVVIHCPSAEGAALVSSLIGGQFLSRSDSPRILRGGERLGRKGECY